MQSLADSRIVGVDFNSLHRKKPRFIVALSIRLAVVRIKDFKRHFHDTEEASICMAVAAWSPPTATSFHFLTALHSSSEPGGQRRQVQQVINSRRPGVYY